MARSICPRSTPPTIPLTDALRLGRETDWREAEGGPVRGVGQRMFLVGEDAVPMMELGNFRFDVA